jgi:hypothetical protein
MGSSAFPDLDRKQGTYREAIANPVTLIIALNADYFFHTLEITPP